MNAPAFGSAAVSPIYPASTSSDSNGSKVIKDGDLTGMLLECLEHLKASLRYI